MAEEIRSDIEKIERALNIRVEDVEIELAFNAGGNQRSLGLFYSNVLAIPQSIVQDCSSEFEGEHSFAMRVNLCAQRNLFQLYKHCQTIVIHRRLIPFDSLIFLESFAIKSTINQ